MLVMFSFIFLDTLASLELVMSVGSTFFREIFSSGHLIKQTSNKRTTGQPDNQTTRQPDNRTTRQPDNQTTRQQYNQTTRQPDNQTTRQPDN